MRVFSSRTSSADCTARQQRDCAACDSAARAQLADQSEWLDDRDYYAEMHAYSLAAALAGVRHRGSNTTMHQTLRRADQGAGAPRRAAPGRARALRQDLVALPASHLAACSRCARIPCPGTACVTRVC
jgi:hypothetical protein